MGGNGNKAPEELGIGIRKRATLSQSQTTKTKDTSISFYHLFFIIIRIFEQASPWAYPQQRRFGWVGLGLGWTSGVRVSLPISITTCIRTLQFLRKYANPQMGPEGLALGLYGRHTDYFFLRITREETWIGGVSRIQRGETLGYYSFRGSRAPLRSSST